MLGCAQTGTGKTAAFALPILQQLSEERTRAGSPTMLEALVLAPTRELADQIAENFAEYGKHLPFRHAVIVGGVKEGPQIRRLQQGIDVLVATPGRLIDLHNRGFVNLRHVKFFVLDEADRMLDMGFIHDIRRIMKALPAKRQNIMFSATLPAEIKRLVKSFLRNPARVEVEHQTSTAELIRQKLMYVARNNKSKLLISLLKSAGYYKTLVFTETKHGANRLVSQLDKDGIRAAAIHGNKSQGARRRALENFRTGAIEVLVATDVASRGIDIYDIDHVVNFDLPNEPEVYVHRIGRTGRAGRTGTASAFCDQSSERARLRGIEQLIDGHIQVVEDHPFHVPPGSVAQEQTRANQSRRPRRKPQAGTGKPGRPRRAHGGKQTTKRPRRVVSS